MAENEKMSAKMSDEELEEVAGGSNFENNQLFKALNEKNPSFAASIEQCYQAALAQGHSQDTARGFANQQIRNVLCALVPQLDASQTFLHRINGVVPFFFYPVIKGFLSFIQFVCFFPYFTQNRTGRFGSLFSERNDFIFQ